MSIAVYTAMQSGNRQEAYRWVIIILFISLAVLLIMNYWSGRRYTDDRPDQAGLPYFGHRRHKS